MKTGYLIALLAMGALTPGCTVVCQNRVFPKLAWYWSADAKAERAYSRAERNAVENYNRTNHAELNVPR